MDYKNFREYRDFRENRDFRDFRSNFRDFRSDFSTPDLRSSFPLGYLNQQINDELSTIP